MGRFASPENVRPTVHSMIFVADDAFLTFKLVESATREGRGERLRRYRCIEHPEITWAVRHRAARSERVESYLVDGIAQSFASGREALRASKRYDDLDRRLMDTFPASDPIARY